MNKRNSSPNFRTSIIKNINVKSALTTIVFLKKNGNFTPNIVIHIILDHKH